MNTAVLRTYLTLEDILETLPGPEIVDQSDATDDMQKHTRRLWRKRARAMGLDVQELYENGTARITKRRPRGPP